MAFHSPFLYNVLRLAQNDSDVPRLSFSFLYAASVVGSLGQLTLIDVDFTQPVSDKMSFNNGGIKTSGYCSASPALVFSSEFGSSGERDVTTRDIDLSAATPSLAYLQFELVMGCGASFGTSTTRNVHLEYSTNLGSSWSAVRSRCGISTSSSCLAESRDTATLYRWEAFKTWQRVTVKLSASMLISTVRFRWRQPSFTTATTWALRNVFIGGVCPEGCNNRGKCTRLGTCECDSEFQGTTCTQGKVPLPTRLHDSFEAAAIDTSVWSTTSGATIGTGCSILQSGKSLYFGGSLLRMAITREMNTSSAT